LLPDITVYGRVPPRQLPSFPTRRSSDLAAARGLGERLHHRADAKHADQRHAAAENARAEVVHQHLETRLDPSGDEMLVDNFSAGDRKSTRLNSSHVKISYAVFCLKKKNK